MVEVLAVVGVLLATVLVLAGAWIEVRGAATRRQTRAIDSARRPVIRPIVSPGTVPDDAGAIPDPADTASPEPVPTVPRRAYRPVWDFFRSHPAPLLGWLETGFWLVILLSTVDHALAPTDSTTAYFAYWFMIAPHELGHLLCMPFGWLLSVAGGSIWQILWWAIPAVYLFYVYRRISGALFFWMLVGHSFINLAPYIRDARARELPLLFGLDSSHHDWWNLLRYFGLLEYDQVIGLTATITGVGVLALTAGLGLLTTWTLPRSRVGRVTRFEPPFWRHLGAALTVGPDDAPTGDGFSRHDSASEAGKPEQAALSHD